MKSAARFFAHQPPPVLKIIRHISAAHARTHDKISELRKIMYAVSHIDVALRYIFLREVNIISPRRYDSCFNVDTQGTDYGSR